LSKVLLRVEGLKKYYPIKSGIIKRAKKFVYAVDNVSFDVIEKQTFALVGESGCGKSTTGFSTTRIIEPTDGKIFFENENIMEYSSEKMRLMRRNMQIIFQDPYSSLNPRMTVQQLISEPITTHNKYSKKEIDELVFNIMDKVGLSKDQIARYPHQFSGGQRQRISIARAIVNNPKLVIADEPVSALDVSIQAQIINLLLKLQEDLNLTYIFISHDLNVVKHVSNKVGVMYLGSIVERADTEDLYANPLHPYTKALLSAVPVLDPLKKKSRIILKGDVPNPSDPPPGCTFHLRCPNAMKICKEIKPETKCVASNHLVACHLYNQ
jgi:oligopeptide/dipeptide ABC transporter ATP-binding protein